LKILNKFVKCHVYEAEKHEEFMTWWKTSKWFYNNEEKFIKQRQKISWDFEKKTRQWKQYCEEANVIKKTSKIICLKCMIVLSHFVIDVKNSIMINHLNSIKCVKTFKNKRLKRISKRLKFRASIKRLS
jgi:uncharacterized membrane protein YkgB